MTVQMTRIGGITVRMGMICQSSVGAYDVLWVQDGELDTVRGEYLLVKKNRKKK